MPRIKIRRLLLKDSKSKNIRKSYWILKQSHESSRGILEYYDASRKGKSGPMTHVEEDLLRSMFIMASSGIDALLKQLVRDTLGILAKYDLQSQLQIKMYASRRVRDILDDLKKEKQREFLVDILMSETPQVEILKKYIQELTSKSLQSESEIKTVCNALGFELNEKTSIKELFEVRNCIVHELDIKFTSGKGRNRRARSRDEMVEYTNKLLDLSEEFYKSVEEKIKRYKKK